MTRKPDGSPLRVKVVRLPHGGDLSLPAYQSEGAAGIDLLAAVEKDLTLKPGARALVPTGLIFEIPHGFEAQVRPRSGDRPFSIGRGERIAQLVVQRVERAGLSETLIITSTRRGAGGFGSTGNVARASTPKRKRGARKAKTR